MERIIAAAIGVGPEAIWPSRYSTGARPVEMMPLPCFRSTVLSSWRLPSLRRVPANPVPRLHWYYKGATTSRSREPGPLWFRLQAPRAPPVFVYRRSAPNGPGRSSSGLEHLVSRRSVPGMSHPWARAGSHRFPGDPSYASALLQDPGRADKTSPFVVLPTPPPAYPNRRPQLAHNIEANFRASASAVYASRVALPPPMQDSLPAGGLRLYREGVEPSGSLRKVSGYIPFSFPGLLLSQGPRTP